MAKQLIEFDSNEKVFQISYKENLAIAQKMMEEIIMDLENDEELNEEMRKVDLMEQDVLHMIEFHNFNASEGYNFAKMLQEIRKERRKIKNRFEEKRKVREFIKNNYNSKFKNPLSQAVKNFNELQDKQDGRTYTLRALKQLEGFNNIIKNAQ